MPFTSYSRDGITPLLPILRNAHHVSTPATPDMICAMHTASLYEKCIYGTYLSCWNNVVSKFSFLYNRTDLRIFFLYFFLQKHTSSSEMIQNQNLLFPQTNVLIGILSCSTILIKVQFSPTFTTILRQLSKHTHSTGKTKCCLIWENMYTIIKLLGQWFECYFFKLSTELDIWVGSLYTRNWIEGFDQGFNLTQQRSPGG